MREERPGFEEAGGGAGPAGEGGESSRDATRRVPVHRHPEYERAVRVGLAISLLLHLVLIFFVSRGLHIPGGPAVNPLPPRPLPPPGLEVVQVGELAGRPDEPISEPPEPQLTEPIDTEERLEPEEVGDPEDRAREREDEEGLTNAERLRPREGDERLWAEGEDRPSERLLEGTARADSAVRAILRQWLDSLRLSDEAYRRARDWTFGKGDDRWGVTPEGLHLGNITIPLPLGQLLSPSGPVRRELEQELRDLREIRRQDALDEARKTRQERIEEMRERSREQAEAEESESDTTSGSGGG